MQSSAVSFSHSLPLLKPRRHQSSSFSSGCNSIRLSSSSSSDSRDLGDLNIAGIYSSLPRRSWTLSSSPFSSAKLRPWTGVPSLGSDSDASHFKVQATAVPDSSDEAVSAGSNVKKTLELGILFGFWYLFNIYFNIYNKQVRCFLFLWNFDGICEVLCGMIVRICGYFVRFAWTCLYREKPRLDNASYVDPIEKRKLTLCWNCLCN